MIPEKIKKVMFSSEYTLRERFFLLGGIIGCMAMIMVFFLSLGTSDTILTGLGLAVGTVILLIVTIICFRTRKITIGGSVVVFVSNCIVMPVGYIWGGAAHSGSPTWFIIGIVFIFMIFRGKLMWFYIFLSTLAFGIATYVAYRFPDLVIPLSGESMIYFDTFVAAIAVAIVLGLLLKFSSMIYEKQAKDLEEKNREVEKMNESQSRFFSSMSHEIRTPINTIIGLDEMILRDTQVSEDISENAQNIQNASKILLSLINDILDVSKIESGRMEITPAQYETSKMLSEIVNLLWTRAKEKNLTFDVSVGENIPTMLYGDEMRLKQVIINILANAIKYTEKGGVKLIVDGEKESANMFMLKIEVEDTGIGIKKENIPYLFDSFKRVDEPSNKKIEGTGLGLTIAKELMDLMGGRITVDSIYTKGTTFHVELPQKIVDDSPMNYRSISDKTTSREVYEQSFEAPEAHVLVVDDNDMNRMVVRKLLRGTRVQTDLAASGRECLDKTKETKYDVIFMDHEMPDMDGVETLTRVRTQHNGLCRNTPMIALTANAGSDMRDFYISHGFEAYLAKPIHGSLLEATLLQLLPSDLVEKAVSHQSGDSFHVSQSLRKRSVIITSESVCDMPESVIRSYGIKLIPYYIITDHGRFRDVTEIDSDNMFNYIKENKRISSAAGTVEEYEQFFAEALSEAETVIHISASSKTSDGYDNAVKAASSFGDVIVYDSGHLTSGLGMIVTEAGRLAKSAERPEKIIERLDEYKKRVVGTFIMPNIGEGFIKQKKSGLVRVMNQVFNFEPVVRLKNAKIRVTGYHIGYVTGAAHKFIRQTLSDRDIDRSVLVITHCGCSVEQQEDILREVKKCGEFDDIYMQKASATIAASSGREAFGLIYMTKEEDA